LYPIIVHVHSFATIFQNIRLYLLEDFQSRKIKTRLGDTEKYFAQALIDGKIATISTFREGDRRKLQRHEKFKVFNTYHNQYGYELKRDSVVKILSFH
jgi:hypothetical protein